MQVKKARRHRRGWTQQQLADAVAEHGGLLDRATVAKIETNRRSVSIDELLLLAAALNVPPPLLLVPLGSEDRVEVTPRSRVHPHLALEWLCGDEPLAESDGRRIGVAGWFEGSAPLTLVRQLRGLEHDLALADGAALMAATSGDKEEVVRAHHRQRHALGSLHRHLRAMQAAGLRAVARKASMLEAMEAAGLDVDGIEVEN